MFGFRDRYGTWKTCSTSAASIFAMRRCGTGGIGSDRCSRPRSAASGQIDFAPGLSGNGIWTCPCRGLLRLTLIHSDQSLPLGTGFEVVKINGETHYLWRAVDHEGEVLEAFVTKRRDRHAALKFLRKAMKRYGNPEVIITDRLRSYKAAMRVIGNEDKQDVGRWLNNRAENSHLPFRRRERAMLRFRRMRSLQKFAAVHSSVHNHFNLERHINDRDWFKENRQPAGRMAATRRLNFDFPSKLRPLRFSLTPPNTLIHAAQNHLREKWWQSALFMVEVTATTFLSLEPIGKARPCTGSQVWTIAGRVLAFCPENTFV